MIKQRSWGDCGVAALAGALTMQINPHGASPEMFDDIYDYVEEALGRNNGLTIQEVCSVLHDRGYLPVYIPFAAFHEVSELNGKAYQKTSKLSDLFHPAIVQVKTASGMLHFVYFDGNVVHDPSAAVLNPMKLSDYTLVDAVFIYDKSHVWESSVAARARALL
ncbi:MULTISPECIES: hypothetical protein [Pseudomonas]|uniref:hypothetical protein n=1 Tax=Pseudomonas TaxID=286 RepID=UPI000BA22464|nr:hypothetical protein [Pseudomonas fragi]PAA00092.1 hypothetical protein CJU76_22775 [Pseudomonas fragi]